jgi:Gene product 88
MANKETLRKALSFKLSTPAKMPGFTFALSASACNVGSKLRSIPGSVCSHCYACKGFYTMYPKVAEVRAHNTALIQDKSKLANWANELAEFINVSRQSVFRYHDSGDLQSFEHLCAIVGVARKAPNCKFWLPTKEYALVDKFNNMFGAFPSNLCVRVSSPMVQQAPLAKYANTSTVDHSASAFSCPVSGGKDNCDNHNCRECWNVNTPNINYHIH